MTLTLLFTFFHTVMYAQLFEQDFSASSVVGDYINPSPGNRFFNSISTSGAGVTVSISGNKLRYVRTGSNTGSFTRNTDMTGPPLSLIVQFDLAVSGSTTAATSVALFYIGNNFSTTNTTEANADVFARFSVNTTTTDGNFIVRDITNGSNSAALSGTTRITWIMNNSGSSLGYKAPDGTIASIESDKADIWGGTLLLFDDVAVQTGTQTIADVKFIVNQGSQTIDIDNILVDPVPPVTVSHSATDVLPNSFTANWNAVAGVTGYRLDVSKMNDFSTYVSGYEGLLINGSATTSYPVSGLLWGNTYYYRVRSVSKYTAGEFESTHSNVTLVVTGVLPLTISEISVEKDRSQVAVLFTNTSESEVKWYEIERCKSGEIFKTRCTILPSRNDGGSIKYRVVDPDPAPGDLIYRVKAVYLNEQVEYSSIVKVNYAGPPSLQILSNPLMTPELVFYAHQLPAGRYEVSIISMKGELLFRKETIFRKGMKTTIPLHSYQHGCYLLRVKGVIELSELFVIRCRR